MKINKELIKPIEFSVLNKKYKIKDEVNSKDVGKDLIDNFHRYFAKILLKNFKTFKLKKNLSTLYKKIKAIKLFYKLKTQSILQNFTLKIISKIYLIQKFVRLFICRRKLLKKLNRLKNIHFIKNKQVLIYFKKKIKFSIILKLRTKKLIKVLQDNYFKIAKTIYLNTMKKESNSMLSCIKYYQIKLIIKFLYLIMI